MKTCARCGLVKSRKEFSQRRRAKDGLHSWCRQCASEYMAGYWPEYKERHPEAYQRHHGPRARFARKVRSNFGLSLDEYDALVAMPCALCSATENIVLDHCHETGKVRGPLCATCNKALGAFGDDPLRLRAAAKYLEKGT